MNLLREFAEQTRLTWLAMPIPSRVISVMLVVAIALGLAMLVRTDEGTRTEYLFGGRILSEQEIDQVSLAFGRAGLNDWAPENRRIKIPFETRAAYLAALEGASLPLTLRTHVEEALQNASVFEPSDLREAKEMHAKEIDLGNKIEQFPDVRYASVEYDVGERVGLGRTRSQSASVVVVPEGLDPLPRHRIASIKDLIRGSYADLSIEHITVIDTNGSSSDSLLNEEDPLMRRRLEEEAAYANKVKGHLRDFGDGLKVAAYAEIDPTLDAEKAVLKYDEQPTTIGESTRKIETETNRPMNQGIPGVATNVTQNRPVSLEENLQTTKTSEDERDSTRIAGQQYEQSRLASLQTRRVRVSVGLPDSYYRKVWTRENPGKSPDDPAVITPADYADQLAKIKTETEDRIKRAVTPLLPDTTAGEDKFDQLVEVWDYPDLPEPVVVETKLAETALAWLAESWQTLALIMLGVIALLVARSALLGGSAEATPAEFREGFGLELPAPPASADSHAESAEAMTITGMSLKEELVELVERNPEVAANVIRGWVGEAA